MGQVCVGMSHANCLCVLENLCEGARLYLKNIGFVCESDFLKAEVRKQMWGWLDPHLATCSASIPDAHPVGVADPLVDSSCGVQLLTP